MSKQPTALYLAEILQSEPGAVADAASAELRRLHAEVNELKRTLALQQKSYEREIEIEVEAEREACAQIAFNAKTYIEAAAAIRARGNT